MDRESMQPYWKRTNLSLSPTHSLSLSLHSGISISRQPGPQLSDYHHNALVLVFCTTSILRRMLVHARMPALTDTWMCAQDRDGKPSMQIRNAQVTHWGFTHVQYIETQKDFRILF